eukprot:TRINITY_DN29242_c0_g1_i1.p1 TRINITY_DN29242_c0_g1~~TRINITY_DN29242_c0_g1_i1.p1  ORF type:complete len:332 (+),score=53.25 TRINITY_DN29242_c0_g1_i1:77-997(+)
MAQLLCAAGAARGDGLVAKGAPGLQLFIDIHGDRVAVEVDPAATVLDVWEAASQLQSLPSYGEADLSFDGQRLRPSAELSDLGVGAESVLFVNFGGPTVPTPTQAGVCRSNLYIVEERRVIATKDPQGSGRGTSGWGTVICKEPMRDGVWRWAVHIVRRGGGTNFLEAGIVPVLEEAGSYADSLVEGVGGAIAVDSCGTLYGRDDEESGTCAAFELDMHSRTLKVWQGERISHRPQSASPDHEPLAVTGDEDWEFKDWVVCRELAHDGYHAAVSLISGDCLFTAFDLEQGKCPLGPAPSDSVRASS